MKVLRSLYYVKAASANDVQSMQQEHIDNVDNVSLMIHDTFHFSDLSFTNIFSVYRRSNGNFRILDYQTPLTMCSIALKKRIYFSRHLMENLFLSSKMTRVAVRPLSKCNALTT